MILRIMYVKDILLSVLQNFNYYLVLQKFDHFIIFDPLSYLYFSL